MGGCVWMCCGVGVQCCGVYLGWIWCWCICLAGVDVPWFDCSWLVIVVGSCVGVTSVRVSVVGELGW